MPTTSAPPPWRPLEVKKHCGFWLRHLRMLPTAYTSGDLQRMTLAYFCLAALDLLGVLDEKVPSSERVEYTDWVYDQQLGEEDGGGFMPGPYLARHAYGASSLPSGGRPAGNLAMTYTALLNLAILGDDFSRLSRDALRLHLHTLQQPDGSFAPSTGQAECDCRFVYCAFAVCEMANLWDAIDVDRALAFVHASRSYDTAFGQGPTQESQGGSSYCALAALSLAGRLDGLAEREKLRAWLVARQQSEHGGFNGRIEKAEDACYSFWCGASLAILDSHGLINADADAAWLLSCQTSVGGIAKTPDDLPDVMHSYLGLAALAMHAHDSTHDTSHDGAQQHLKPLLRQLEPRLNISTHSLAHLRQHLPSRDTL